MMNFLASSRYLIVAMAASISSTMGCSNGGRNTGSENGSDAAFIRISSLPNGNENASGADIVFIHGLGGNAAETWKHDNNTQSFPEMLAADLPNSNVWVLNYDAAPSAWLGKGMSLRDNAKNILFGMYTHDIGTKRPVIFVCHSLGGLVAKQMFEVGLTLRDENLTRIADRMEGFVFFATPHKGAPAADFFAIISRTLKVFRPTETIRDLKHNSKPLLDLNQFFIRESGMRHLQDRCLVFYETSPMKGAGMLIVPEESADPGLTKGSIAIPARADHVSICKPINDSDLQYKAVLKELKKWTKAIEPKSTGGLLKYLENKIDVSNSGGLPADLVGARVILRCKIYHEETDGHGKVFDLVKTERDVISEIKEHSERQEVLRYVEDACNVWQEQFPNSDPYKVTRIQIRPAVGVELNMTTSERVIEGRIEAIELESTKIPKNYDGPGRDRRMAEYKYWDIYIANARVVD